MKIIRTLFRYIKPYKKYVFLNIFFNILLALFSAASLAMLQPVLSILFGTTALKVDKVELIFTLNGLKEYVYYQISLFIIEHGREKALIIIVIAMITIFLLKNLTRYLAQFFIAFLRNHVVKDLRNAMYQKILRLPLSYYSEERKGDILSKISNDVQEIEWSILNAIEMFFREPILIITYLVSMIVISPQFTMFVFLFLPVSGLIIGIIGKNLKRSSAKANKSLGELLAMVEETLTGLRVIKAFNAKDFAYQNFKTKNENYTKLMIKLLRKRDLASPLSEFLGMLTVGILIWYGGKLIFAAQSPLSPEAFITYLVIFSQLLNPAKDIAKAYSVAQKGVASAERIDTILNAEESIKNKPNAIHIKTFNKAIVYKNVWFKYQNNYVLKNINFTVPKGKMVALVGQSGAGKSTIADLLPRFYDVDKGEILIDGTSITELDIYDLRALLGIVGQHPILFNDTIFNNIAFGLENITKEQVVQAAKIANAHEFIEHLEQGYETNIGDSGNKLSGGQKQRISIARAILHNPPILILDEATSALDTESERLVQEALQNLMKNRSSIVIAHRLSTIQHADEIIVLKQGEIIERGTHQDLLAANGAYKRLCDMQSFV